MLRSSARIVFFAARLFWTCDAQLLGFEASVFSKEECNKIIALFRQMELEQDERANPLLPLMQGEFSVSRSNRYDDGSLHAEVEQFILPRLLQSHELNQTFTARTPPGTTASAKSLARYIDFTLLHEFLPGGHFDWHVDTKPNDERGRTVNLNIMLSPSSAFAGGELQVGEESLAPQQGDAYIYPAATPHRVRPLHSGARHTLVVALTERHQAEAMGPEAYALRRAEYWGAVEANFQRLTTGALSHEQKVHILFGEHLEALGRTDEAKAAFCQAYRVPSSNSEDPTAQSAQSFAASFFSSGVEALGMKEVGDFGGAGTQPDLQLAQNYLAMAACVDPDHPEASEALAVVREALRLAQQHDSEDLSDLTHDRG